MTANVLDRHTIQNRLRLLEMTADPDISPEVWEMLRQLNSDLDSTEDAAARETLVDRLNEHIAGMDIEFPATAAAIRSILYSLANMGV